jgi:hypothetical protein
VQFQPRPDRRAGHSLLKKPLTTAARRAPATLDAAATAAIFSTAEEAAYVWNVETDALAWSANACDVLAIDSLAAGGERYELRGAPARGQPRQSLRRHCRLFRAR